MVKELDEKEITAPVELFWANIYQLDAVAQQLIEKGMITEQRIFFL